MRRSSTIPLGLVSSVASLVGAQYSGWKQNQVNASMCSWQNPRVGVIRDTAYIDGGYLWWTPGLADGTMATPLRDTNPQGNIFMLNFSKPFNTSANISEVFGLLPKGFNGNSLNNLAPNYYDGALLGNDDEFFLYGGLLTQTSAFSTPDAESILAYQLYQYGQEKQRWSPGFLSVDLPKDNLTRYLAFGGSASVPSENKAYYFGGLHSPSWGELYIQNPNASYSALNASNTFITLDLTTQQEETWSNTTLPNGVKGRGGVELVWVPVGAQGILVALGGVTYPDFSSPTLTSLNEGQSEADSPAFIADIDIYDIAAGKWYKQPTSDGPSQSALGCAVVAVAEDASSYNIYYYGGYDGIHQTQSFNDDVWILSLPSFLWRKVSSGNGGHARAGHRCVKPYPDQMIVIGGYPAYQGGSLNCLEGGVLQIFNLTAAKWMDTYDPEVYSEYGVPEVLQQAIGGNAKGTATMTAPTSWATPNLAKVFETPYPSSKITTYYPYAPANTTVPRGEIASSSVPSWLAPVLGVVLGLVFISAIVVGIMLYRRRKLFKRNGGSEGATDENGYRILSWMRGQDASHKAQTVVSEEPSNNVDYVVPSVSEHTPYQRVVQPEMSQTRQVHNVQEMPDTPLFEMMDTSPRAELSDTGLTPIDIINKHSHFGRGPHSTTTPTNPSSFSNYSSNIDHASISTNSQSRANFPIPETARPDSPPLGNALPAADDRVVSDLSNISNGERAHLRNISDASVSTATDAGGGGAGTGAVSTGAPGPTTPVTPIVGPRHPLLPPGPVSPPSAIGDGREDYFQSVSRTLSTGQPAGSPDSARASSPRRSVFVESRDDLQDKSTERR